jgi:hypothetical protein
MFGPYVFGGKQYILAATLLPYNERQFSMEPTQPPQEPTPPQQPPATPPPAFPQQAQARAQDAWRGAQARLSGFPPAARIAIIAGSALVALCLVCAVCAGLFSVLSRGGSTTAPISQRATNTPKGPTATPTPNYAHFGDGTFQVGKDIQPGTYRTRSGSDGCYYARLKGFSGSFDDIIANNNTSGPAVITIAASDKGFLSQNCGTWTQNLSQITKSKTSFEDGAYIVGTDIEPGTYKNTGDENCYWQRLRDFSGTFDGIIANGNPTGAAIVAIKASDKGFSAARCGTWTKQ